MDPQTLDKFYRDVTDYVNMLDDPQPAVSRSHETLRDLYQRWGELMVSDALDEYFMQVRVYQCHSY